MVDYRQVNRNKMVAFFERGGKFVRSLGFELEHILLHKETHEPVSYSEPGGVRDILNKLASFYDEEIRDGDDIIGLVKHGQTITIEPAGQLEISAGPFQNVVDVERTYLEFRHCLDPILDAFGIEISMLGYNPSARASDLELIPKYRYKCMTEFLGSQAYEGICMMRGTASLQVSIDFRNEADAMRKLRIAEILSPVFALMCDNSPKFEGEERSHQLVRTAVWAGMNQDRVGTIPGSLAKGFSFADYADYIMTREAILIPDSNASDGWRYVGARTFDELYATREMTDVEIEHALSMVWPDVRLKSFMEIRPADAMPIEYCLAYAVLVHALFYNDCNLEMLDSLLSDIDERDIRNAKKALMQDGYGAQVYGRAVEFWTDLLIVLAQASLEQSEKFYLEPLASMVKYRFTLAEIWPQRMAKHFEMFAGTFDAPIIGVVPRYDFEWTGLSIGDGYLSGLLECNAVPIVLPATTDPEYIKRLVSLCDGFLIPGGQDINPRCYGALREPHTGRSTVIRDKLEQQLVPAAIAARKPILGICRGMQSLNVALGGTLYQDIYAEVSEDALQHVQGHPFSMPTHMVDIAEGSRLASVIQAFRIGVNTIHHQSIAKLGEGLVVSAVSPADGVIEAIELSGDLFVVGVQWHPEYMWRSRPHSKRLFHAFVEAAKEEAAKNAGRKG